MTDMMPRCYRPRPPLDSYVECFWYFSSYDVRHDRERALPTGTTEIVFSLGQDPMRIFTDQQDVVGQNFRRSVVCGPHSRYFMLDTSHSEAVVGIHFRPGRATPFLRCAASELSDRTIALEDLWGTEACEMQETLFTKSPSHNQMFQSLENKLLSRIPEAHLPHPAVAYAIEKLSASPNLPSIRKVQADAGYSPKRLIELFNYSVGLTPKVFSRIQRFQAAIMRIAQGDEVDWAGVAVDSGYYDQSHLNREFRVFSGVTPAQYRPVSKQRPSHVAA